MFREWFCKKRYQLRNHGNAISPALHFSVYTVPFLGIHSNGIFFGHGLLSSFVLNGSWNWKVKSHLMTRPFFKENVLHMICNLGRVHNVQKLKKKVSYEFSRPKNAFCLVDFSILKIILKIGKMRLLSDIFLHCGFEYRLGSALFATVEQRLQDCERSASLIWAEKRSNFTLNLFRGLESCNVLSYLKSTSKMRAKRVFFNAQNHPKAHAFI